MVDKSNRIYELRKKAGLSQEKLGDELGCNKSKISKLENGNQELTQSWMVKITRALNKHGLNIAPADLLPADQSYLDDKEKDVVEEYRTLKDSQKAEFDAMFKIIKTSK